LFLRPDEAYFPSRDDGLHFRNPVEVVTATRAPDVTEALTRVQRAVDDGKWAAGYLAYEAADAFDPALTTHPPGPLPVLWFGIYDEASRARLPASDGAVYTAAALCPALDAERYGAAVTRIREAIAAGALYQANFTFPMNGAFHGDPFAWWRDHAAVNGAQYTAYLNLGRYHIASLSPELFFALDGNRLMCRPMKGTRSRGRWPEEDAELRDALARSEKDRAENIMIVDLIRNDLGRIADFGSVSVPERFTVEPYDAVWQMTSTVTATTNVGVSDIFGAWFPSGSVTGAPKIETMRRLRELEQGPRGVYCGAIGYWGPGRQARFNVAIRTATIDTESDTMRYDIGSGITWDSEAAGEYDECLAKAHRIERARPAFELLETIAYDGEGFVLLERHLDRMAASAAYFGYPFDRDAVNAEIQAAAYDDQALRVRVLLSMDGRARIESTPLVAWTPKTIGLAAVHVDSSNRFLYHKTTHRVVYHRARATRPECDEAILVNERGELTEGAYTNIALTLDGQRYTPPIECGLLPGVYRAELIARGDLLERVLTPADLKRAEIVEVMNSVRGLTRVTLVS